MTSQMGRGDRGRKCAADRLRTATRFPAVFLLVLLSLPRTVYGEAAPAAPGVACATGDRTPCILSLPDGRRLVVAEGELEPRSIGSYSIRLYAGGNPDFPFDDFVAGTVVARYGTVEQLLPVDLDGDGAPELVVLTRSVGTGNYLSGQAFRINPDGIVFLRGTEPLPPDGNPLRLLRR